MNLLKSTWVVCERDEIGSAPCRESEIKRRIDAISVALPISALSLPNPCWG